MCSSRMAGLRRKTGTEKKKRKKRLDRKKRRGDLQRRRGAFLEAEDVRVGDIQTRASRRGVKKKRFGGFYTMIFWSGRSVMLGMAG